jgi:hypothetical protein
MVESVDSVSLKDCPCKDTAILSGGECDIIYGEGAFFGWFDCAGIRDGFVETCPINQLILLCNIPIAWYSNRI